MLWQLGTTPQHWLYEVWIDGIHATDAIAANDCSAVVMRHASDGYERDGLGRIIADLIVGNIDIRRVNPGDRTSKATTTALPDRFTVVESGSERVYRI